MLKPQWFLKTDEMSRKAKEAVEQGMIKLQPEHHVRVWQNWFKDNR